MNDKVKGILDKLKTMDLEKEPVEEVRTLIKELQWFSILAFKMGPGNVIMRARTGWGYSCMGDLTYPPYHRNTTFGRANTKSKPMFYGTYVSDYTSVEAWASALSEVSLIKRKKYKTLNPEKITFARWMVAQPISLVFIVPNNNLSELYSPVATELKKAYLNFVKQQRPDLEEDFVAVTSFFADEFAKNVQHDYEYLLSAVFTEVITEVITEENQRDGVMYLPIGTKGEFGFNVGIKPIIADNCLRLDAVGEATFKYEPPDNSDCHIERSCDIDPNQTCFTFD
jgi:hypothetical protein